MCRNLPVRNRCTGPGSESTGLFTRCCTNPDKLSCIISGTGVLHTRDCKNPRPFLLRCPSGANLDPTGKTGLPFPFPLPQPIRHGIAPSRFSNIKRNPFPIGRIRTLIFYWQKPLLPVLLASLTIFPESSLLLLSSDLHDCLNSGTASPAP